MEHTNSCNTENNESSTLLASVPKSLNACMKSALLLMIDNGRFLPLCTYALVESQPVKARRPGKAWVTFPSTAACFCTDRKRCLSPVPVSKENIIAQIVHEMLISQQQYKYVSVWRLDDNAVFVVEVLVLHGVSLHAVKNDAGVGLLVS